MIQINFKDPQIFPFRYRQTMTPHPTYNLHQLQRFKYIQSTTNTRNNNESEYDDDDDDVEDEYMQPMTTNPIVISNEVRSSTPTQFVSQSQLLMDRLVHQMSLILVQIGRLNILGNRFNELIQTTTRITKQNYAALHGNNGITNSDGELHISCENTKKILIILASLLKKTMRCEDAIVQIENL